MRIILTIALVASLLAGCGATTGPWTEKTWEDAASPTGTS